MKKGTSQRKYGKGLIGVCLCVLLMFVCPCFASADDVTTDILTKLSGTSPLTQPSTETGTEAAETSAQTEPDTESAAGDTARVTSSAVHTTVDLPLTYGLRVLAAREEMVLSGLCGNELTLHRDDVCRAMNLSNVSGIVITSLPSADDGILYVGADGAAVGQSVPAEALSLVSFVPNDTGKPCSTVFRFTIPGCGYEMNCRLCFLKAVNYTPTVSMASALSLSLTTYCDVPVMGNLSGYDPEGDRVEFEIVSYPTHGLLTLHDRSVGSYTYTPDRMYCGNDMFSYVVRDEWGNWSSAATVNVVVNAVPTAVTFADLDGEACHAAALTVASVGLMNGTRVGNLDYFRPGEGMTRCDFIVTAMNAADLCPPAALTESDISQILSVFSDADQLPEAMRPYLAYAVQKGAVTGFQDKNADGRRVLIPNAVISRAEASVLLSNLIGYASVSTVNAFADSDRIPDWSIAAFNSLKALGIFRTVDGTADATAILTRGDAAVWLARTVQLVRQ